MISTLQISGVHSNLTDEMKSYIYRKIGGLDKFIPTKARGSISVEVKIKEISSKNKSKHVCEVIMKLPKKTVMATKDSINVLSAIDEVEASLKNQLKKYRNKHSAATMRRHFATHLKAPKESLISELE